MRTWIAFALVAAGSGAALAQAGPERAATRVGDVHVYSVDRKTDRTRFEETVTVTNVGGGRIMTRHSRPALAQDAPGEYGSEWDTVLSGASGFRFDPPARVLSFPLEVGKAWGQAYQIAMPNGERSQMKMESRVAGLEKVVTPAGEFDAFRIEAKGYLSGVTWRGGFQVNQTAWYAPSIDRLVRVEYRENRALGAHNVTELKAFKRAE